MATIAELLAEAALGTARKEGKALRKALKRAADPYADVRDQLADLGRAPVGGQRPAPAGTVGREDPRPLSGGRISQRYPDAAGATENPVNQNLLVNIATLAQEPKMLRKVADLIATYPNATPAMKEMTDPLERVNAFRDLLVENKLALHDMMPAKTAARTSKWYHGANRIANERAAEVGIDPVSSAGAYAAQSPQKDWEQNVYLGDTVLRTLHRDPKVTPEMADYARATPSYRKDEANAMETGRPTRGALSAITENIGRRLSNLDPSEQAAAIRAFDEVYNTRNSGRRAYHRISPEGDYLSLATNQGGDLAAPGWGSFRDIEKALRIAQSGGDMSVISDMLGRSHKVRNFHNDIVNPAEAAKFGDYTADTHDIASSNFQPMSGNTPEVGQGMSGPPKSDVSGLKGLYPIYADAGRIAGAMRGLHPYQMQSITWEAVRSLFPAEFKTEANMQKVRGIWQLASEGKITRPVARKRIVALTGGFNPPKWMVAALGLMGLGHEMDNRDA